MFTVLQIDHVELFVPDRYEAARWYERTLGLPEVQLGIHPGFGGSVRSVQLLGVLRAMDMMLPGKNIRGTKACYGM